MRFIIKSILIGVAALAVVFSLTWDWRSRRMKSAQLSEPIKETIKQERNAPEVLLHLTDEERALNAGAVILNQPDFVALPGVMAA
jgi:hypothetical protein